MPTHRRRPFMPRWLASALVASLLLVAAGAALGVNRYQASLVRIPDVVGMRRSTALSTLRAGGLLPRIAGQRFSMSMPAGCILAQSPARERSVPSGTRVQLVLSAGADTIVVPDVVDMRLSDAQADLEALGLHVIVERVTSSKVRGTVLESYPASGARARTGDIVRLSVSGQAASTEALLPYDLQGIVIAIDPSPAAKGRTDVEMDVTRRVRALFEASGAQVVVSRSLLAPATGADARASAMASPTADAVLGIATGTKPGLQAVDLPSNDESLSARSHAIGTAFTGLIHLPGYSVNAQRSAVDPVLSRFAKPGIRVLLGSWTNTADASRLADPDWADAVARAIYRAFGATLKPR